MREVSVDEHAGTRQKLIAGINSASFPHTRSRSMTATQLATCWRRVKGHLTASKRHLDPETFEAYNQLWIKILGSSAGTWISYRMMLYTRRFVVSIRYCHYSISTTPAHVGLRWALRISISSLGWKSSRIYSFFLFCFITSKLHAMPFKRSLRISGIHATVPFPRPCAYLRLIQLSSQLQLSVCSPGNSI